MLWTKFSVSPVLIYRVSGDVHLGVQLCCESTYVLYMSTVGPAINSQGFSQVCFSRVPSKSLVLVISQPVKAAATHG